MNIPDILSHRILPALILACVPGQMEAQTAPPALAAIDSQVEANPGSADVLLNASRAYLEAYQKSSPKDELLITKALTHAAKAAIQDADSAIPQVQLARGFLAWGQKEKAKERAERALELDSANAEARALLTAIDPAAAAALAPSSPPARPQTPPAPIPNPSPYVPKSPVATAPPPDTSPAAGVVDFAAQYIQAGGADSAALQARYFAPVVESYFGDRNVTRFAIEKDQQAYMKRWPNRTYSCTDAPRIVGESDGAYTVIASYRFAVSNPASGKSASGTGQSILKIRATASGYEILLVEEKTN